MSRLMPEVCFFREKFWENLATPLFGTLPPPSETTEVRVSEPAYALNVKLGRPIHLLYTFDKMICCKKFHRL